MKSQKLSIKEPDSFIMIKQVGGEKSAFSFIEQLVPEKAVKRDQADVTRWALSNPVGERFKKVNVLDSEDLSETFYKLLKLQAGSEVDT